MYMNVQCIMLWSDVTEPQDTVHLVYFVWQTSCAHSLLMRANKLETAAALRSLALTVPPVML